MFSACSVFSVYVCLWTYFFLHTTFACTYCCYFWMFRAVSSSSSAEWESMQQWRCSSKFSSSSSSVLVLCLLKSARTIYVLCVLMRGTESFVSVYVWIWLRIMLSKHCWMFLNLVTFQPNFHFPDEKWQQIITSFNTLKLWTLNTAHLPPIKTSKISSLLLLHCHTTPPPT